MPDVDFVLNCADSPVVPSLSGLSDHHVANDAPVVSMCGSTDHRDIIVPTYVLALAVTGRTRVDEPA